MTETPDIGTRRTRLLAELRAEVRAFEQAERARAVRAGRRPPRTVAEIALAEEGQTERHARAEARAERRRRRDARRTARLAADDPRPAVEPIDLDTLDGNS